MRTNPAEHTTLLADRAAVRTSLRYAAVRDCRRGLSAAAVRRQMPQPEVRSNIKERDRSRWAIKPLSTEAPRPVRQEPRTAEPMLQLANQWSASCKTFPPVTQHENLPHPQI